jgi:hypothetical protein
MTSVSDTSLLAFKAISNFVNDLDAFFSKTQRSLKLYSRLLSKTTLSHSASIQRHVDAFRNFCRSNRDAISSKNYSEFSTNNIQYSDKIYINMQDIFKRADKDNCVVVWNHLLYISAIVDPSGKAKEILKENLASGKTSGKETDFLTDIINKVEKNVDPNANPMEAVSSIMQSGLFTELLGGLNNGLSSGSLDINNLMGAVQGLVGNMNKDNTNPQMGDAMNMITSMMGNMGNMGNMGGSSGSAPDMSGLMGMMSGMMGGIQSPPQQHVPVLPTISECDETHDDGDDDSNLDSPN